MGDDAAAQVELGLSLIKQLSCKKKSREKALCVLLKSWLPSQPNISDDIMRKLWRGLFYCIWDADLHSCGGLIDRLFSLLPDLHNDSISLHYLSTFLLTVRREWCAVNAPSFYLLIRRFLHYSFAFLKFHYWDSGLTSRLISILGDTYFSAKQGKKNSFEVCYRIVSVFLEELTPFLPLRPEVLEVLFEPFISVLGPLPDEALLGKVKRNMFDSLLGRIKCNMFDVLLEMGNKLLELKKLGDDNEIHDNDDAVVLGTIALTMGFSSKFLELGSSVEWNMNMNTNRKLLFMLHDQFLKLEKDLEFSRIQVSIPRGIERVPTLIPIGTDMEVGGLEKPLKKNKKKKASGGSGGKKKKIVATEVGLDNDALEDVTSACELLKTKVNGTVSKKRNRAESMGVQYKNVFCDFYYFNNGMKSEFFVPPELVKITFTKHARRNTVVALKIFLSNGKQRGKTIIGSGAVISEDGLVLTCAHLLHDYENPEFYVQGAKVVFYSGQTYKAKVIIEDVGKDLALLKICVPHHPRELKLSRATFAMPQTIKRGMDAYMVVNPLYFQFFQLTEGTIRYKKRLCRDLEFENVLKLDHDSAIIQTDIDCKEGCFGGPLFNSNWEIMGVQFANKGTLKFGIHVESILIFLDKCYAVMEKNIR